MCDRIYHETASGFIWFLSSFIFTQRHPADGFIIFLGFSESIFLPGSLWTPPSLCLTTRPAWTRVLANFIRVLFLYYEIRSSLLGKSEHQHYVWNHAKAQTQDLHQFWVGTGKMEALAHREKTVMEKERWRATTNPPQCPELNPTIPERG